MQDVLEANSELIASFSVILGTTPCKNDFKCQESSSQVFMLYGQVKLDEVIRMKADILVS